MVDIFTPEEDKSHPLLDAILILITAGFAVTAVVYVSESFMMALIPLLCALMFFAMYLAHKNVIGGR